jgi:excisionase family DNA binding protein
MRGRGGTDAEYLSPKEAAQVIGVSEKTIRRRIADGTLPAVQFGQLWRIRRSDLERVLTPRQPGRSLGRRPPAKP